MTDSSPSNLQADFAAALVRDLKQLDLNDAAALVNQMLQEINALRMAERLNVETVAQLQRNRDALEADLKRFVAHAARGVQPPSARPMTLGRLILDIARGDVKERTLTQDETQQLRESMAHYFRGLHFVEPESDGDARGPRIEDAAGNVVACLYWPCHPVEETAAAEQATYALGRAMAAVVPETKEAMCSTCEDGECSVHPSSSAETPAAPLHRMLFTHWSKDPLIPYAGCECSSCKEARAPISVSVSDGTATSAETDAPPITPMNCPHCDGIAPQGELLHAPGCPLSDERGNP